MVEIGRQLETEEPGSAACDVGVGRKIREDLDAKRKDAGPKHGERRVLHGEDLVRSEGHIVRDHQLLEKAPRDEHEGLAHHGRIHRTRTLNLREQVAGALNRAGHELREEGDEERVIAQAAAGPDVAAGDIDDIADALKRVERDPGRQDDVEHGNRHRQVQRAQQRGDILDEEIVILEDREQRQVARHAHGNERFLALGPGLDSAGHEIVDDRRGGKRQQEPGVDKPVENETRRNEQRIAPARRRRPVDRQHQDEKHDELKAVENHRAASWWTSFAIFPQKISV